MRPSAATRLAFLSALARPCLRSHSIAVSMLPAFSVSAFLHSIMPAPERSRSSLTRLAVICIALTPLYPFAARAFSHPPVKEICYLHNPIAAEEAGGDRPLDSRGLEARFDQSLLGAAGRLRATRAAARAATIGARLRAARGGLARALLLAVVGLRDDIAFGVGLDELVLA